MIMRAEDEDEDYNKRKKEMKTVRYWIGLGSFSLTFFSLRNLYLDTQPNIKLALYVD